jgi:hypothetical protein
MHPILLSYLPFAKPVTLRIICRIFKVICREPF